jgi:hypothetical protein
MNYKFRPAARSEAKPLIGLYAESGGGKTKSALLLAKGFCGDMGQVGMIETEAGRGEAWANDPVVGGYQVLPIRGDFNPKNYGQAISAAEEAKLQGLIVDSASHEWEGVGGVLAMAAENQAAGKKGPLVWQQPKMAHQREFMLRLMQTPIPLVIVCMRAKYPMYQISEKHVTGWRAAGGTGKPPTVGDWARSTQLDPKQSEDILFEMFIHGWLDKDTHSFHGTKYTLEELRQVIKDGEPISVETGQRLAAWAKGSAAPQVQPPAPSSSAVSDPAGAAPVTRTDTLMALCQKAKVDYDEILKRAGVTHADEMTEQDYKDAKRMLDGRAARKAA